jgi:hypothetical protein
VLPSIEALRDGDPMTERVAEQIALGVSTRGYGRSLEPVDATIEARGASKSNASRALIDATAEKLAQFVSRKLDDVDLVAMFIDGIEFAGHAVRSSSPLASRSTVRRSRSASGRAPPRTRP